MVKMFPLLWDLLALRTNEDTTHITYKKSKACHTWIKTKITFSTWNKLWRSSVHAQIFYPSNHKEEECNSVWCMYQGCPHHSERQIEESRVEEITPGGVETPCSSQTPVVMQKSLKGAGKWAEALGALTEQKISHAEQCHHHDES